MIWRISARVSATLLNPKAPADCPDLDLIWDLDHPENTIKRFREILDGLGAVTESSLSLRIELLTQFARARGLQEKFSEAEGALSEAEDLLKQDTSRYKAIARIRFLLEKGRLCCLAKTPSQARPLFSEAFSLANQAGEIYQAVDAAQMMAAIESPKLRTDWILKGIGLAEQSNQPKVKTWLGALYSTLGWHFYELRQYDKAAELFGKAVACLKAELDASSGDSVLRKRLSVAKWAAAKTLRLRGKVEDALVIQKELLDELLSHGGKTGDVCEELAECLTTLKRTGEAETYFGLAYKELSQDEWVTDNMPDRIKRLKALGKVK